MYRITADYIFSPAGLLSGHCLDLDEKGAILDFRPIKEGETVRSYAGVICPGFVNAHCHLELSFLRGEIPMKTGMTGFILNVLAKRQNISEAKRIAAVFDGLREAYYTGTVAIGDICNTRDTVEPKRSFPELFTHSFVELLGLNAGKLDEILYDGRMLQSRFGGLSNSLTLHAPYSISAVLRDEVYQASSQLLSIHFLESEAERQLFEKKEGDFYDFYEKMGIPVPDFESTSSIDYLLKGLPSQRPVLFVHNTEITEGELEALVTQFPHAYFCLCPRSNRFIHNTFPDIEKFLPFQNRICLGTDSLASNDSLSMLDEIFVLQQSYPNVSLHMLLTWACTHGAAALQQSHKFGKFAKGTQCGVNLIENMDLGEMRLTTESVVRKLF